MEYMSAREAADKWGISQRRVALETDTVKGFTFVWFTDGKGWISARNNLEETFDIMENIYNIKDLENGVISEALK